MSQTSNAPDNSPDPRLASLYELSGINETDVDLAELKDSSEVVFRNKVQLNNLYSKYLSRDDVEELTFQRKQVARLLLRRNDARSKYSEAHQRVVRAENLISRAEELVRSTRVKTPEETAWLLHANGLSKSDHNEFMFIIASKVSMPSFERLRTSPIHCERNTTFVKAI